jgi:hypothetical protein
VIFPRARPPRGDTDRRQHRQAAGTGAGPIKRRDRFGRIASESSRAYRFRVKEKPKRIAITLSASFLKGVDEWRRKQRDRPSRAVAIQRLAERGGLAGGTRLPRKGSRRKAAEMAEREIEGLGDQAASNEERARRSRRLIQGPREFRDIRANRAKTKAKTED